MLNGPDRGLYRHRAAPRLLHGPSFRKWAASTTPRPERRDPLRELRQPAGHRRIDALFAEQAARTPDAPALLHRGVEVSYQALDIRANRLAHYLVALGVGPETIVGVALDRTPDLVVTLLAILKAGGAYLPLDPAYPVDRLQFMLADSSAPVLVARTALGDELGFRGYLVDLDTAADMIAAQPSGAPMPRGGGSNLAYVIYTSGSTGRPKGVMLEHSAAGLVEWARRGFAPADLARVAATSSICFDPSVLELFAPLCTGGLVILKENALEPFAPDEQPTMLNMVPSVLSELVRMRAIPDSVRVVNIGGETLKAGLVRDIYAASRAERIYNHYGPTEATTCVSVALVPRGEERDPPIGAPICNARFHILDEAMQPAETGQLYIAGEMLARGYLNNAALTEESFVPDPFGRAGDRMYRTGDMVRRAASGELEFLGRAGDQVKLHGYRIELGEIETSLLRLAHVRQCAVMLNPDARGRDRLVAYVASDASLTLPDVRRGLAAWLPDYMLPSALVVLPALPLTLSGKIDRAALKAIEPAPREAFPRRDESLEAMEQAIADAFREALDLDHVGGDDDFFEIGGNSLLAIELALHLEDLLGCPIAPAAFAHGSTPNALARVIREFPVAETSHLATLRATGSEPPVFCLPDISGNPFNFVGLTRRLGPDRPVYGLSPGPLEDALIANPSIALLTRAYLAEVRRIQPHGPYRVCGFSFGTIFAFDLARALEAAGEDVLLILLDPVPRRSPPSPRVVAGWLWREVRSSVIKSGVRRTLQEFRRLFAARRSRNRKVVQIDDVPIWVPDTKKPLARALMQARANYEFQSYGGRTALVQCVGNITPRAFLDFSAMLGWRKVLTGTVDHIAADTTHHNLMREPYVEQLIASLEPSLSAK